MTETTIDSILQQLREEILTSIYVHKHGVIRISAEIPIRNGGVRGMGKTSCWCEKEVDFRRIKK